MNDVPSSWSAKQAHHLRARPPDENGYLNRAKLGFAGLVSVLRRDGGTVTSENWIEIQVGLSGTHCLRISFMLLYSAVLYPGMPNRGLMVLLFF